MYRKPSEAKRREKRRLRPMQTLELVIGGFDEGEALAPDTSFSEPPDFGAVPLTSEASFETSDASFETSDASFQTSDASFESIDTSSTANVVVDASNAASELAPSDGGSMSMLNSFEPNTDWTSGNDTSSPATHEIPTLDPDPMIRTLDPDPVPDNRYGGPFRDGDFLHDPRSLTPGQAQGLEDLMRTPGMHPWAVDQMRQFLEDYRNGVDRIFPDNPNPFPRPYPTISDPDGNVG